jgi:hypothetical protein
MFCPRCSQEQVSSETKFCSRCGFPLGLVSEILAHGGFLPQLAELYQDKKILTRKNGLIFALFWFMIFTMILTPFWAVANADELTVICALIGVIGGLILTIASFAFLRKEPKNVENINQEMPNHQVNNLYQSNQTALPPQQSQPAQSYVPPADSWKAPETGDLIQPNSVTDATTKLLKKKNRFFRKE